MACMNVGTGCESKQTVGKTGEGIGKPESADEKRDAE